MGLIYRKKCHLIRTTCYLVLTITFVLLSNLWTHAQVKKRLYIGNDDHTDYMWSGDEAQYDTAFVKMLDFQLRQIDSTKNNLADFQSRFNCDGSYWVKTYAKFRNPAQFDRLISAIRSGHISVPITTLVNTYGAQPTEAALRGMYYAGHLERKYGFRLTLANAMENNTFPLGLSSLWAGSGAKYCWKGIGNYGSQLSQESMTSRRFQLYRSLGPDSSGVIMKWYNEGVKGFGPLGSYAECRLTLKKTDEEKDMDRVIGYLYGFSKSPVYPFDAAAAFGYGHDNLASFSGPAYINAARRASDNDKTVRVSNEVDFFEDIQQHYPKLPSQSLSFGNEWDVLCASMNETTAKVRRATEKLRSAEALACIVALKNPDFSKRLEKERDLAWDAYGMYWEHNWTADGPVSRAKRAAWQVKLQKQVSNYSDTLQSAAAELLGQQLSKSAFARFFVFNALAWERSTTADVLYKGKFPVKVIDIKSGSVVPCQKITVENQMYLRIIATHLPSVGYKVFEIRPGTDVDKSVPARLQNGWINNSRYNILLTKSGVIVQIYDKIAGRQIVSQIDGKYLNDLGTKDLNSGDELSIENAGPVSITFKAVSPDPILHTTRLTLFANSTIIEIANSIDTNFNEVKTWAYSFNLSNATTHHEELGAILNVRKKFQGGDYSDQNARYDWQTFNHFADMSENHFGITLSNLDCSFFKLGKGTVDSLWSSSSQINALAGGQVDRKVEDKGLLGIPKQNGEKQFHYAFALTTHNTAFDPINAMKFALEHQNKPITGWVSGNPGNNNVSFSLVRVDQPGVLLWSVKPSEDGIKKGLVTRFWNMNSQPVKALVKLSQPISGALLTTHIETDLQTLQTESGQLPVYFKGNEIKTFRILSGLR